MGRRTEQITISKGIKLTGAATAEDAKKATTSWKVENCIFISGYEVFDNANIRKELIDRWIDFVLVCLR